jgi:hypothetical protein
MRMAMSRACSEQASKGGLPGLELAQKRRGDKSGRVIQRRMSMKTLIAAAFAILLAGAGLAEERYVGYYFPEITSEESFTRVVRETGGAGGKAVRIDFVNALTIAQLEAPANPRFVFFAKGSESKTLILTALDDEVFSSLYRARAILAQLTVSVRQGEFFQQEELQYVATFFDLLQLMQFDELLITDGETWTHRVEFLR